ncbi:hypothetical protein B6N60_04548 [Richelia sinica FACHB-800]|uniref:ATPase AAA-type core domain-containing protein n=1 Tax=Richelia sinica FACHB-800 TaxID=1357546 RepID=A0A975Y703_9NOST|nr:ATP-binding protein [Richelia sinica]MBD2665656.1 AAA family ATPase [Richelia sinica FACHB-800]QXE25828.1 hypothetical protein B6N60_04548 [Richelia sinica FACHB-800]
MWISEVTLNNFRSFGDANIQLSKGINLIVGANNSGKSTLLKSILWLQKGFNLNGTDLRMFKGDGYVHLVLKEAKPEVFTFINQNFQSQILVKLKLESNSVSVEANQFSEINRNGNTTRYILNQMFLSNEEPENFIYPYLSKRKVAGFEETINSNTTNSVRGNLSNLYAKIDRISNPQIQENEQYVQACKDIIGFQVTTIASDIGKKAAYIVSSHKNIPLDAMGEGVGNLVGLIVDLCMAENRLFLIEEPENDIHPKALKKLLNLIAEKSANNQFIITTHSNIVAKYLGALPDSKLFSVSMDFDENRIPTSHIEEIPNTPEARRNVLEELGYDFFDFDLWSAWLILEESSAERIIREFLIPWFAPDLQGRINTFSTKGIDKVITKFDDFNNIFVFLHLQPAYKNLAWVIVDGGPKEKEIIEQLKTKYTPSGWNANNFLQFSEHEFEKYYPERFELQIEHIIQMPNGKHKQQKKKDILEEVIKWVYENPEQAKSAFQESASEVIDILKNIQLSVSNNSDN